MFGRRLARSRLATVLFTVAALVVALGPVTDAIAFDRTNIPLKNWGGLSEFRDAVYDDLERLVTAGLADRTILNTKPFSRAEAARIVSRAIKAIRDDTNGVYNNRQDLEAVLTRLMQEFRAEIIALGTQLPGDQPPAPGMFSFTPIDR